MVRRVASRAARMAIVTKANRHNVAKWEAASVHADLGGASTGAVAAAERQVQSSLQKAVDIAAAHARFAATEAAVQVNHVAQFQRRQAGDKLLEHQVMARLKTILQAVVAHPNKAIQATATRLLQRLKEVHANVARDKHRVTTAKRHARQSLKSALVALNAAKLALVAFPRVADKMPKASGTKKAKNAKVAKHYKNYAAQQAAAPAWRRDWGGPAHPWKAERHETAAAKHLVSDTKHADRIATRIMGLPSSAPLGPSHSRTHGNLA